MKPTIVFCLFLVTSLLFAQNPADVKFQDASPKGAPASLSVKYDPDIGLYAAVRNTSGKGILAFFAIIEPTDSRGQSVPCHSRADFIFKDSVLAPQAERFAFPMDTSTSSNEPGATVVKAVGAVLWVQFEDGSTWGDAESGKQILSVRSRKLAFALRTQSVSDIAILQQLPSGTRILALCHLENGDHLFSFWPSPV